MSINAAAEITNLSRLLRSDKETERRRAMKTLSENWIYQSSSSSKASPLRVEMWNNVISACIIADSKEVEAAKAKKRAVKPDFAHFLVKCVRLAESSHANFLCFGGDPKQQGTNGCTQLGSSSRTFGILAPHVVSLLAKVENAFEKDALFDIVGGPDCYGSILRIILSSPYYLSLITPRSYEKLARLLCELIISAKAGRYTHQLALALKLLFQNGGFDLHTILEAAFHFFGSWCEEQLRSKESSYGSTVLDESVLHIFGCINLLLARHGRATSSQLFAHGDKILRFVLPQLNVSASRKDLHAAFLEYLCRHMAVAGATPHGGFDLDVHDPISSRVGSLCRALLDERELSALSNRLGNPLEGSSYQGGGLVTHQLGVVDTRLSGFDSDGLPMFLNNSLNGSKWDPLFHTIPGMGSGRELDSRARLHLHLLARLIVHSSTQYTESTANTGMTQGDSNTQHAATLSPAQGSGGYWLWLKKGLLQAMEVDTVMANSDVKSSASGASSASINGSMTQSNFKASQLSGRTSSGGGNVTTLGGISIARNSSGGLLSGTSRNRSKRMKAGAPPSQPLKSLSFLMLTVTVLEMYPNGEAWRKAANDGRTTVENKEDEEDMQLGGNSDSEKVLQLSQHCNEILELLTLFTNVLGGLALAPRLQLHDGFAPNLQVWSLIGLSQLVNISHSAILNIRRFTSSPIKYSTVGSSSSHQNSLKTQLISKSKQMYEKWDFLCSTILFQRDVIYWRSISHANDHVGELVLALLAQLVANKLLTSSTRVSATSSVSGGVEEGNVLLSLPCYRFEVSNNDAADVHTFGKDKVDVRSGNTNNASPINQQQNGFTMASQYPTFSSLYFDSGFRLLDQDRVPSIALLELSTLLLSKHMHLPLQRCVNYLINSDGVGEDLDQGGMKDDYDDDTNGREVALDSLDCYFHTPLNDDISSVYLFVLTALPVCVCNPSAIALATTPSFITALSCAMWHTSQSDGSNGTRSGNKKASFSSLNGSIGIEDPDLLSPSLHNLSSMHNFTVPLNKNDSNEDNESFHGDETAASSSLPCLIVMSTLLRKVNDMLLCLKYDIETFDEERDVTGPYSPSEFISLFSTLFSASRLAHLLVMFRQAPIQFMKHVDEVYIKSSSLASASLTSVRLLFYGDASDGGRGMNDGDNKSSSHRFNNVLDEWDSVIVLGLEVVQAGCSLFELDENFGDCLCGTNVNNDATLSPTPFFESLAGLIGSLSQIEANAYAHDLPNKPSRLKTQKRNTTTSAAAQNENNDTYTNNYFPSSYDMNGLNEDDGEEVDSVIMAANMENSWRVPRKDDLKGRLKKSLFKVVDNLQTKLERFNISRENLSNNSTTKMTTDRSSGIGVSGSQAFKKPKLNNGSSFMDTDSEEDEEEDYNQPYYQTPATVTRRERNSDEEEYDEDEEDTRSKSRRAVPVKKRSRAKKAKDDDDNWSSKDLQGSLISSEMTHWLLVPNSRAIHETAHLISLALARASFHEKYKTNQQLSIRLYGGFIGDFREVTGRINGGSRIHLFARYACTERLDILRTVSCFVSSPLFMQRAAADARRGDRSCYEWIISSVQMAVIGGAKTAPDGHALAIFFDILTTLIKYSATSAASMKDFTPYHESINHIVASSPLSSIKANSSNNSSSSNRERGGGGGGVSSSRKSHHHKSTSSSASGGGGRNGGGGRLFSSRLTIQEISQIKSLILLYPESEEERESSNFDVLFEGSGIEAVEINPALAEKLKLWISCHRIVRRKQLIAFKFLFHYYGGAWATNTTNFSSNANKASHEEVSAQFKRYLALVSNVGKMLNLGFRSLVTERLNDVDKGVRDEAIGAVSLLLHHYKPESHAKIYEHVLNCLPPLPKTNELMQLAYFFDERSSAPNERGHLVGHRYFATSCYVALINRACASWYLRHLLESTSLKCRASLAITAGRVHLAVNHARNASSCASTVNSGGLDSAIFSSSSPISTVSSNRYDSNYYMQLAEASPYPPITLNCLAEFVMLASDRPDLKLSLTRLIAQINASFGFSVEDPSAILRDPPVLVHLLSTWILEHKRSTSSFPYDLLCLNEDNITKDSQNLSFLMEASSLNTMSNEKLFREASHSEPLPFIDIKPASTHRERHRLSEEGAMSKGLAGNIAWVATWLMPIVARLPPTERFIEFESIASILGYGSGDEGMAKLLVQCLHSVKAEELVTSLGGEELEASPLRTAMLESAKSINTFTYNLLGKLQSQCLKVNKDKMIFAILRRALIHQAYCCDQSCLSTTAISLSVIHKTMAALALGCHKPLNDLLAAENISEILLRVYCCIRSSPALHTKNRLASTLRLVFLATMPSNNSAAEANAPEWTAFSQNPDSESQTTGKTGSSSDNGGGKNADLSESTARVMLHICISLLREEVMSSNSGAGSGGWLSEAPLFFIVVNILSMLITISLDPNNQSVGKEVDASFIGKHLDLIIQVLIELLFLLHRVASKLRHGRKHYRRSCAGLQINSFSQLRPLSTTAPFISASATSSMLRSTHLYGIDSNTGISNLGFMGAGAGSSSSASNYLNAESQVAFNEVPQSVCPLAAIVASRGSFSIFSSSSLASPNFDLIGSSGGGGGSLDTMAYELEMPMMCHDLNATNRNSQFQDNIFNHGDEAEDEEGLLYDKYGRSSKTDTRTAAAAAHQRDSPVEEVENCLKNSPALIAVRTLEKLTLDLVSKLVDHTLMEKYLWRLYSVQVDPRKARNNATNGGDAFEYNIGAEDDVYENDEDDDDLVDHGHALNQCERIIKQVHASNEERVRKRYNDKIDSNRLSMSQGNANNNGGLGRRNSSNLSRSASSSSNFRPAQIQSLRRQHSLKELNMNQRKSKMFNRFELSSSIFSESVFRSNSTKTSFKKELKRYYFIPLGSVDQRARYWLRTVTDLRKQLKKHQHNPDPVSIAATTSIHSLFGASSSSSSSSPLSQTTTTSSENLIREEVLRGLRGALLSLVAGSDSGLNDYESDTTSNSSATFSKMNSDQDSGIYNEDGVNDIGQLLRHEAALLLGEIGTLKLPEPSQIVSRWQTTHSLYQAYDMDEDDIESSNRHLKENDDDLEEEDEEDENDSDGNKVNAGQEKGRDISIQTHALTMICEALLDPEPHVILVTIGTVKSLLASAEGELAYLSKDCNQDVKRLLHPFVRSKHSESNSLPASILIPTEEKEFLKKQISIQFRNGEFVEFTSRKLWAPNNSDLSTGCLGYGSWLCNLTARLLIDCYCEQELLLQQQEQEKESSSSSSSSLLKRNSTAATKYKNRRSKRQWWQMKNRNLLSSVNLIGNDMFLKLCLPLCQIRPSFAELIFPAIIDDLTAHTSFEARKLISECLSNHLLDCQFSSRSHLRAMRLCIHSVNLLRTRMLRQFSSTSSRRISSSSSTKAKQQANVLKQQQQQLRLGGAGANFGRILPWATGSTDTLLDLDFLRLASAAVHCGCYCSAVMYAEWACEHFYTTPAFALKEEEVEMMSSFPERKRSYTGKSNQKKAQQDVGNDMEDDDDEDDDENVLFQDKSVTKTYGKSSVKSQLQRSVGVRSNSSNSSTSKAREKGWSHERGEELRRILLKAYHCLGQNDSVHALRGLSSSSYGETNLESSGLKRKSMLNSDVDNDVGRGDGIQRQVSLEARELVYLDSGDSIQLLTHCDAALQSMSSSTQHENSSTRYDLLSHTAVALKRLGLMHVASSYLHSLHVNEFTTPLNSNISNSNGCGGGDSVSHESNHEKLRAQRYACAWRALDWDIQTDTSNSSSNKPFQNRHNPAKNMTNNAILSGNHSSSAFSTHLHSALPFDEAVHGALKSLTSCNQVQVRKFLERGRMDVLKRISTSARDESCRQIYPAVLELQALNEISEASDALFTSSYSSHDVAHQELNPNIDSLSSVNSSNKSSIQRINKLWSTWQRRLTPLLSESLTFIEPLLSVREVTLRLALEMKCNEKPNSSSSSSSHSLSNSHVLVGGHEEGVSSVKQELCDTLSEHLFTIVELSRESGKPSSAMVPLRKLSSLLKNDNAVMSGYGNQKSSRRSLSSSSSGGGSVLLSDMDNQYQDKVFYRSSRLKFEEARVMWSVGETDLAMKNLKVLAANISHYQSNHGVESENLSLLSLERDVLTLLGEFAAHTRSSGSDEVVELCLKPAVDISDEINTRETSSKEFEAQAATHLKLAEFLSQLHVSLKNRLSSPEWASARRVAKHRKKEYDLCVEQEKAIKLRMDVVRNAVNRKSPARKGSQQSSSYGIVGGSSGGEANLGVEDFEELKKELNALYRHKLLLSREVDIDNKEHKRATSSANQYLVDALTHYRHALKGGGAQLRTIFRVIKIWLENSTDKVVNESMRSMVHEVPSYKWLPLTYQLSSRLGANPIDQRNKSSASIGGIMSQFDTQDELNALSSSSNLTSSETEATFATVLETLLWRICTEHPHHSIIQVFALAHGDSLFFGETKFGKMNVDAARVSAANQLLQRLYLGKAIDHGGSVENSYRRPANNQIASNKRLEQVRELVIGLDALVNGYIDLARCSTQSFINAPSPHKLDDLCARQNFQANSSLLKNAKFNSNRNSVGGGSTAALVPFHRCLDSFIASQQSSSSASSLCIPSVLTHPPQTSSVADYANAIRIQGFDSNFNITDSGLHRPVIIHCVGEDGRRYQQLVKGNDDVRQDMVMMQVFSAVNTFLGEEKGEQIHKRIRTYTVVPLSPEVGVMEWVQDTIPIGNYLIDKGGKRGAHSRYHAADWAHHECRQKMKEAKESGDPMELKRVFSEVCKNLKPAFRYFFLEYFAAGGSGNSGSGGASRKGSSSQSSSKQSNVSGSVNLARFSQAGTAEWYERRLTYCSSLAASSMVGHIMGIGDRHTQNILVDTKTAEVVHIDFGIVFEQGKTLSTPETVPFRLTRDMVDGLGITGVEGLFKNCCEDTLRCLRRPDNAAALATLAEVFIYDPLYRWMLSPLQAIKRQRQTEGLAKEEEGGGVDDHGTTSTTGGAVTGSSNRKSRELDDSGAAEEGADNASGMREAAERILTRIRQKLQGYEDPNDSALSVEGQVRLLIASAVSEENLHKIFMGWAPWL